MKNKVFAVEETLYGVHNVKMVIAANLRDAREKSKRLYGMVVPKAYYLPLKKKEEGE